VSVGAPLDLHAPVWYWQPESLAVLMHGP
jgi:hypothetical protein